MYYYVVFMILNCATLIIIDRCFESVNRNLIGLFVGIRVRQDEQKLPGGLRYRISKRQRPALSK